jgi:hypothetical protein
MNRFAIRQNIDRYTRLRRTAVDDGTRRMLLSPLAEEQAKLKALTPGEIEQEDADS